jgi:organic hydroperoxide reductase OsmC/OhrA
MHEYTAQLAWQREGATFTDRRYSRRHLLRFDGGATLPASSSPLSVRPPYSDPAAVDPEELLVASLSSCHMLWFLDFAARAGWVVEAYEDDALGVMAPDERGRTAITTVTLRPRVRFAGEARPDTAEHERLHHAAHEACFIANTVRAEVRCQPVLEA